jgi:hypothetical protein
VVVPVALGVPAVLAFVPPLVAFPPATLPRLVQFQTLVICLPAVASMSLDGKVDLMLRVSDSALAVVVAFCVKSRNCCEKQSHGRYGS